MFIEYFESFSNSCVKFMALRLWIMFILVRFCLVPMFKVKSAFEKTNLFWSLISMLVDSLKKYGMLIHCNMDSSDGSSPLLPLQKVIMWWSFCLGPLNNPEAFFFFFCVCIELLWACPPFLVVVTHNFLQ